jgi:hypothetical protein
VTRVRRMATGAFATMGAEMVIAAIVNVRICGTKSGRQIDGSAAFRPRNPRASPSNVGFQNERFWRVVRDVASFRFCMEIQSRVCENMQNCALSETQM